MGKGRSGFNAVIALLFLVSTASLYSQQSASSSPEVVDVTEVISRTETRFQWDPYREQGTLVRGSSMLTFRVGTPLAVGNLTEIHRITPPERRDGTIVFDRDFLALAMRLFPRVDEMRRIAGIFIDPGHGGKDPGAVGTITGDEEIRTIQEKDVVLAVGRTLRDLLVQRYPDKQILMSRDADRYLTLEERTTLANAIETAPEETVVFVSIHANASLNAGANGFEVWFLPPEFRRRNLVDPKDAGVDDPDLLTILNTMREEEITIESILLARNVLAGMESRIGDRSPNRGLREESWYVVRNAKMPSILVEVGFVTNPSEQRLLEDPRYLREVTEGIYTGLTNFIRSYEELGTQ